MAATNIAQSPEEQQKKTQQAQQANNAPVQAQASNTTTPASVTPQAPQVATASPIAKTDAGDIDLTADVDKPMKMEAPNYYKTAANQQRINAKKYEAQAQRYTPESDEAAKKRARKERIGLIHAGVFDGLAALSNFWAANRGVAGAYDASKGASVAMGTAFEKAQQHREQNRQIYDNYMDKAKAAQLSANQLLQQWEDKQIETKYKNLEMQFKMNAEVREALKSANENEKHQWDMELTAAKIALTQANATKAEWDAKIAEINSRWLDRLNASTVNSRNASANKANKEAQGATTVTEEPLITRQADGSTAVTGTIRKTTTKTPGNGGNKSMPRQNGDGLGSNMPRS